MRLGSFYIAVGMLALCVGEVSAATRALVVGVSGYPNLPESIRLVGPKNDSREFANTLVRLGIPAADITVLADQVTGLADGVANPGAGTKKAILDRLARLAETSEAGDLVVFYFSGHGSQQPDLDGDEQGGADEIFLPYDVGKWGKGGVENALVDDELNLLVERILDKGADFFGVIDACHSATGFRAIDGDDTRIRGVEPAALGIPDVVEEAGRGLAGRTADTGKGGRGRAAFFYAAQENEEALEKTPPNATDGESYAVFTYELLQRLNQNPGVTYRALHQGVLAEIKRNTLMTTQTPDLEGELLDEPVLGLAGAVPARQWQVLYGGKLQAGVLEGLSAGSILALYDDAAAPDDSPVAYGVIGSAGATRSLLLPTAKPCGVDEAVCATAAAGEADFKRGRFARLVRTGVDLGLVLSEPVRVDPDDGKDYSLAMDALREAVSSGPMAARVSMRASGYDIAVGLVDGKLAFSPAGGMIDRDGPGSSPRLTLPEEPRVARARVEEAIDRMARATALQRLAGAEGSTRSLGLVPEISIAKSRKQPQAGGTCSEDEADYEGLQPVGDNPRFDDCDILNVRMANTGRKPLDVTVLLIGPDFSITPVWPVDGASSRILAQESKTADILQMEPNPAAAAEERLVFLAIPGVNRSHTAFTDLEQDGLRATPDDAPQVAAVRDFVASGLNDLTRSTISRAAAVDEDMSIDIRPFFVTKGGGR